MDRRSWNPLYTLRWLADDGGHEISGSSRDIHAEAPTVNRMGDDESAWDIAVLDESGADVTGEFFAHLDTP